MTVPSQGYIVRLSHSMGPDRGCRALQALEEQHLYRAQSTQQEEQNSQSTSYGSDGSSSSGADMDVEV